MGKDLKIIQKFIWKINYAMLIVVVIRLLRHACDPMNCSMPGFSVLHHLPDLAQAYVH